MELVIVFLLTLAALIVVGYLLPEPEPPKSEFQQHMERFAAEFKELQLVLGRELTPVMRQTITAFEDFEKALKR